MPNNGFLGRAGHPAVGRLQSSFGYGGVDSVGFLKIQPGVVGLFVEEAPGQPGVIALVIESLATQPPVYVSIDCPSTQPGVVGLLAPEMATQPCTSGLFIEAPAVQPRVLGVTVGSEDC